MIEVVKSEIENAKLKHKIIEKVVVQLQKDFQFYEEKIELTENSKNPYLELFDQVLPIISRMLNLDSARFFSLLYSIDISEKKVKEILFGTNELDAGEEITHLILERELQKVMTRIAFSKGVK